MGRGRKGLIEQSQKKPKKAAQMFKEGKYWWKFHVDPDKYNSIDSIFWSNDCLEAMKKTEPKEVADILFK